MKKVILCLTLLTSLLLLVACGSGGFRWDKSVEALKEEGFTVVQNCTTEKELEDISASLNSGIKFDGGTFTIRCTKYTNLNKGDHKNSCMLMEFSTVEEAKQYYDHYIKSRTAESQWKLTLRERVVVLTNSDEIMEIVGGTFA